MQVVMSSAIRATNPVATIDCLCIARSNAGTEQVPSISFEVKEHRNLAVRLDPRRRYRADASGHHSLVERIELIKTKEEPHASSELLPNYICLMLAIGACQQNACLSSNRSDNSTNSNRSTSTKNRTAAS